MLRYPDGKREQVSLPEQAKLLVSGVNGNPSLSRGKPKLENFCTLDLRERCIQGVLALCSVSFLSDKHWFCVSPLQLGFCVHSSVISNPHAAHFHSKMTLNGFCINC